MCDCDSYVFNESICGPPTASCCSGDCATSGCPSDSTGSVLTATTLPAGFHPNCFQEPSVVTTTTLPAGFHPPDAPFQDPSVIEPPASAMNTDSTVLTATTLPAGFHPPEAPFQDPSVIVPPAPPEPCSATPSGNGSQGNLQQNVIDQMNGIFNQVGPIGGVPDFIEDEPDDVSLITTPSGIDPDNCPFASANDATDSLSFDDVTVPSNPSMDLNGLAGSVVSGVHVSDCTSASGMVTVPATSVPPSAGTSVPPPSAGTSVPPSAGTVPPDDGTSVTSGLVTVPSTGTSVTSGLVTVPSTGTSVTSGLVTVPSTVPDTVPERDCLGDCYRFQAEMKAKGCQGTVVCRKRAVPKPAKPACAMPPADCGKHKDEPKDCGCGGAREEKEPKDCGCGCGGGAKKKRKFTCEATLNCFS